VRKAPIAHSICVPFTELNAIFSSDYMNTLFEYAKQPSFLLFYSSLRTTSVTPMRCEEQPETSYREQSATRRAAHLTDFFGSDANSRPQSKTKKP